MFKAGFENVEELKKFLENSDFSEVKFFINPDYVDAIIGISDEGKVVYDYNMMVEHLTKIYAKESDCEDPYMDAIEWIDYNCDIPQFEIVYNKQLEEVGLDEYFPELINKFRDYEKYAIGANTHGVLLIDSELVTDQNIDDMESILKECNIEYKIV